MIGTFFWKERMPNPHEPWWWLGRLCWRLTATCPCGTWQLAPPLAPPLPGHVLADQRISQPGCNFSLTQAHQWCTCRIVDGVAKQVLHCRLVTRRPPVPLCTGVQLHYSKFPSPPPESGGSFSAPWWLIFFGSSSRRSGVLRERRRCRNPHSSNSNLTVGECIQLSLGDATLLKQASKRAQLPDFPGPTSRDEQCTIHQNRGMNHDHSVYFSKVAIQADDEWHTGSLHTGVFAQLGSGSRSTCESQSIPQGSAQSWCSSAWMLHNWRCWRLTRQ